MGDYRNIALLDFEEAIFNYQNKRYRSAIFFSTICGKKRKGFIREEGPGTQATKI